MFNILRKFDDIITNTRIIAYEYEENQFRIKLQLSLSDGSSLAVKDYKFSNNQRKFLPLDGYRRQPKNKMGQCTALGIRQHLSPSPSCRNNGKHSLFTETDIESVLEFIRKTLSTKKR